MALAMMCLSSILQVDENRHERGPMTRFGRSANYPWLVSPTFGTAFFLAALLTGCNSPKEPVATAKQMEELQATLRRIEGELITLRQGIPRDVEQKLRELEIVLNDRKQWPPSPEVAEKMRQSLDEIVQALSPIAAERILPQLARLNWGVEALWNLRTHAKAVPNQLEEVQATVKEVSDRHPRGHFNEIQKELESRLKEIDPQLRAFQLKQLLERANRALEGKDDASAAFSSLEEFRREKEVATILPKLRAKVLEKTGIERIDSLEKNLMKTCSFADDRVRQISLLNIQEGVLRLTVDLEMEDAASKEILKKAKDLLARCDNELLALAAKQQDDNAKKVCRYQAWALKQIRKFDSPEGWYYDVTLPWIETQLRKFGDSDKDEEWEAFREFPSLKDLIQEKVGVDLSKMKGAKLTAEKRKEIYKEAWQVFGWKNSIHTEVAYRATRDGMVKFLAPIQPHLLDPPVAHLYQQAFSKGWQKLEGREDQLFVAQQSAVVQKKTLDEMAASNP
jgi:hypothetical protein